MYRRGALKGYGPDTKHCSQASSACSITYEETIRDSAMQKTTNNDKVMRSLQSSHSSSSLLTAANHRDSSYCMKTAIYSTCPMEAPSLGTPYIKLLKKQKVTSVPLDWLEVKELHHQNSYKPLQRDTALTGKSSEKPCKPELDPCVTPELFKLQLRPAAVCYLGQDRTISPERTAFKNGKEEHCKGLWSWGFRWRKVS